MRKYEFLQPFNQSETLINIIRQIVVLFFNYSPVEIKEYIIGLYTLEGLSNYYKKLEMNNYVLKRPFLYLVPQDTPRLSDELLNVNIQTTRASTLLLRTNPRYFESVTPFFPFLISNNELKIARIEQYLNINLMINIVCESYEMAYDIMRFSQSILTDKVTTFRNLINIYMFSVDDVLKKYPEYVVRNIDYVALYSMSSVSDKKVYAIPGETWAQVKATDFTINSENIPFDSTTPVYILNISLNITYSEPVSFLMIY